MVRQEWGEPNGSYSGATPGKNPAPLPKTLTCFRCLSYTFYVTYKKFGYAELDFPLRGNDRRGQLPVIPAKAGIQGLGTRKQCPGLSEKLPFYALGSLPGTEPVIMPHRVTNSKGHASAASSTNRSEIWGVGWFSVLYATGAQAGPGRRDCQVFLQVAIEIATARCLL